MSIEFLAGPIVKLSYSADQWELYDDEKLYVDISRDDVAAALNSGLESLIARSPSRSVFGVGKLLDSYSKYGAADSEGYRMAGQILDKVYGIS